MVFNQTGERNAAFGYLSGKSGSKNAGFGAYSLNAVTGDSNTAVGYYAGGGGNGNATGANNVIVGYQAGVDDAAAANKIVIGQGATGTTDNTVLLGNGSITNWLPTDTNEVDLGSSTKEMKDIYVDGVAYTDAIGFGTVAMTLPTADGSANQVLKTDGSGNLGWTAAGGGGAIDGLSDAKLEGANFTGGLSIGHAMTAATLVTANYNTAIGVTALDALTEGDLNVAVGYNALTANTTGTGNTAIGYEALKANTTGSYNVA